MLYDNVLFKLNNNYLYTGKKSNAFFTEEVLYLLEVAVFFLRRSRRKKTVTESKYKTSKVKNALFTGIYVVLFTDIAN